MKITRRQLNNIVTSILYEDVASEDQANKDPDKTNQASKGAEEPKKKSTLKSGEILTKNFKCVPVPPTEAVAAAKKEAEMWQSGKSPDGKRTYKRGYMKETDREAKPVLKKYFDSVKPGQYFRQHPKGGESGTAWSAAFVTYCMQQADGEAKWDRSINHRAPQVGGYLHLAWNRRKEVEVNPEKYIGKTVYLAFSANEIYGNGKDNEYSTIKPKDQIKATTNMLTPGDVVGKRRENGKIHMDIYIGGGQVIGGNIGKPPNTCKSRALNSKTSDVIKRVRITQVVNRAMADSGRK